MKEIIKSVLDDLSDSQINLSSETARETISNLIVAALYENEKIFNRKENEEVENEKIKVV